MSGMLAKIRRYYCDVDQSTSVESGFFKTNPEIVARIAGLFADGSVYDRQGSSRFAGRKEIQHFFSAERALRGTHSIQDISEKQGVHLGGLHMPPAALSVPDHQCATFIVQGSFTGTLCHFDSDTRRIRWAQDAQLRFTDYWVTDGEHVLYRASDIQPERKIAAATPRGEYSARY